MFSYIVVCLRIISFATRSGKLWRKGTRARMGHFADTLRSLNNKTGKTMKEREQTRNDLNGKAILTSAEAAAYLGVSLSTLHKWTMARAIPFSKPNGKLCFFERRELEAWAMSGRVSTSDEIKARAQAYCLREAER